MGASVTRHPSTPRAQRPEPSPVVVFCATCSDPVVPTVSNTGPTALTCFLLLFAGIIPGILCMIWRELAKRGARTCPRCHGADLVPLDSTRASQALGARREAVMEEAWKLSRKAATDAAVAASREKHLTRQAIKFGIGVFVIVFVGGATIIGVTSWQDRRIAEDQAAQDALAQQARLAAIAAADRERAEHDAAMVNPTIVYTARRATLARAHPRADAEPVMRIPAGGIIRSKIREGGWTRILGAEVEAWISDDDLALDTSMP